MINRDRLYGRFMELCAIDSEPTRERLLADRLTELLSELGFAVIGPITSIARALSIAREATIAGAILDINLGGESIYPVADALALRAVPFVFVTGYSADGIDSRYVHVHTLQKPVEPETLRRLFVEDAGTFRLPARPSESQAPIQ